VQYKIKELMEMSNEEVYKLTRMTKEEIKPGMSFEWRDAGTMGLSALIVRNSDQKHVEILGVGSAV
jgi:hypothetical protein